ncbi:hypothetical protein SKAU_G00282880 [Synaphobranchus kaupii]|uniref:RNA helicase n=1 Tax=Synaphobranchus kaupii TaxID=118154 RepID=A0A9Q1EXI6_SYNKA|nr:hypothetical protein SKAU_G00282880 [Synaphobranchus kaupii]
MAQRKKKLTKKRRHMGSKVREPDLDSDGGEFELSAQMKDDTPERKTLRFPAASECLSDVEPDTRQLVRAQNKKKKKSGGFQSMGLGYPVFKGVMKKGYKVPTPIQRKTIPMILDGKDVLGRFTGLKTALILGGDSMDDQFAALHENPDIIIGTPGRLMHVVVQMNLKLQSVEYVVFDEADRLFEMGFAEQLQEVIRRLPDTRQTVLFSATLPKLLVEFARAGLTEPVLIRLDVDTKLNDQLQLAFFHLRLDEKPALLLHLLRNVLKPQEQTVVFVATKHHVEYLKELLTSEGVECAYIYSALDQTARKINIGRFVHRKAMVLLVTDVAARGIDIPLLDNVINYNFPSKAKLFLHRVGRVARAGRSGTAYSLVCSDEVPFVYDLHLFLGRPIQLALPEHPQDADGVFGRVPQSVLDDEEALLITAHQNSLDLQNMHRISENAYKQYLKSRPSPSPESFKRVKNTELSGMAVHPLLGSGLESTELDRLKIVDSIKGYKSKATIFEINSSSKTAASVVMRAKRSRDTRLVDKFQRVREDRAAEGLLNRPAPPKPPPADPGQSESEDEDIQGVFSEVVGGKRKKHSEEGEGGNDFNSERGLSLGAEGSAFELQASSAVLDLMGDEGEQLNQHKSMMKWDRKKKRFVRETGKEDKKKKLRTDSGQVASSKKKNFYEEWKKKYKMDDGGSDSEGEMAGKGRRPGGGGRRGRRGPQQQPAEGQKGGAGARSELRSREQILKSRKRQQKQQFLQSGGLKKLRGPRQAATRRGQAVGIRTRRHEKGEAEEEAVRGGVRGSGQRRQSATHCRVTLAGLRV